MSIGLLDLLDANVQLWHAGKHVQSPGYALLHSDHYLFGGEARAAARLQPRDINTRYWWQLSTEALQPKLGPARHTGDLAHAHLQALHQEAQKPTEMLLAVPGSMQREQLSLLLGIMQQCPFDAVGLVNRSVALASLYAPRERLFHLEVQLHQSVISQLLQRDGSVELERIVPLPGCGMLQLQERLVEIIAAAFVRQTRFDPRRKAVTEQQLYDTLPAVLRALQTSAEANIEVNGYRARINAAELHEAGSRLFDSARQAMGTHSGAGLIADPLAALLPGLGEAFSSLDIAQAEDMRRALEFHQPSLLQRDQTLHFVTSLNCLAEKNIGLTTPDTAEGRPVVQRQPTHLLQGGVARPLIAAGTPLAGGWEIYQGNSGWHLRGPGNGLRINDRTGQDGQLLSTGDVIAIDKGESLQLIEVEG